MSAKGDRTFIKINPNISKAEFTSVLPNSDFSFITVYDCLTRYEQIQLEFGPFRVSQAERKWAAFLQGRSDTTGWGGDECLLLIPQDALRVTGWPTRSICQSGGEKKIPTKSKGICHARRSEAVASVQ